MSNAPCADPCARAKGGAQRTTVAGLVNRAWFLPMRAQHREQRGRRPRMSRVGPVTISAQICGARCDTALPQNPAVIEPTRPTARLSECLLRRYCGWAAVIARLVTNIWHLPPLYSPAMRQRSQIRTAVEKME
jgi:hypothetical protein